VSAAFAPSAGTAQRALLTRHPAALASQKLLPEDIEKMNKAAAEVAADKDK
jgi:hypothetical protein